MKIRIDDYCIRCGICIDLYPELYVRNWDEDRIDVLVDEVPENLRSRAIESARNCAVCAIKLREWKKEGRNKAREAQTTYRVGRDLCEGCSVCAASCPTQCISEYDDEVKWIDNSQCIACDACRKLCPCNAIHAE